MATWGQPTTAFAEAAAFSFFCILVLAISLFLFLVCTLQFLTFTSRNTTAVRFPCSTRGSMMKEGPVQEMGNAEKSDETNFYNFPSDLAGGAHGRGSHRGSPRSSG